jgi:hypothetical protein
MTTTTTTLAPSTVGGGGGPSGITLSEATLPAFSFRRRNVLLA